jgi:hypothetical protein
LALLLFACGCYRYAYAPYGGYGYPAYPAAPVDGGMGPTPTYVPGYGNPTAPGPTPLVPNGTPSTPNWQQPGGGNSAPLYDNPAGSGGLVPAPTDADDQKDFGPTPTSGNPGGAEGLSNSDIHLEPIETEPATPTGAAAPSSALADHEPFESPMRPASSGGATVAARTASLATPSNLPNPFAHDVKFTWLRGIVDFDPQDQRWVIVYSADPEGNDRYGGCLTLSDHAVLKLVKPGDVVYVEGTVDESSLDQHGKPIYRIDAIKKMKPKG